MFANLLFLFEVTYLCIRFMELFYTQNICGNICSLDEQESVHCTRVLRHKPGDIINVIDGCGSLMKCKILSGNKNSTELEILEREEGFGTHNYYLTMAVCPTKNIDRYEWFLEKATEMGMDRVVPVIGEHSERKIVKSDRCEKILLSAAKQSLKGAVPVFEECCSVKEFIASFGVAAADAPDAPAVLKLIAYCGEATKLSVKEALAAYMKDFNGGSQQKNGNAFPQIAILIGPEGDFSQQEVDLATANGFIPVHLGKSRLRTETAAVVSCCEVYSLLG